MMRVCFTDLRCAHTFQAANLSDKPDRKYVHLGVVVVTVSRYRPLSAIRWNTANLRFLPDRQ